MNNKCPLDEMLADYLEGRLVGEKAAQMEAHLSECDRCMQQFVVTGKIIRDPDFAAVETVPERVTQAAVDQVMGTCLQPSDSAEENVWQSIKDVGRKALNYLNIRPWGEAELAPIRSSKKMVTKGLVHLKKTFANFDAEIEIEKTSAFKAIIRVKLTHNNGQHKGIRVTLKREQREISSQLFNGSIVLFEDIPFGLYQLTFSRKDVLLGEYVFEIKESVNG